MDWHVEVALQTADHLNDEDIERIEDLIDALSPFHPAVSVSEHRVSVATTVVSETALTAFNEAVAELNNAVNRVGLQGFVVVAGRVSSIAELDNELTAPTLPPIAGVAEIAEKLGVSRQRVSELSRRDEFPKPIARLSAGPVWLEPAIDHFVKSWPRKPGRNAGS